MPIPHIPLSLACFALAASLVRCGACEPDHGAPPAPSASAAPSVPAQPLAAPSASFARMPRPQMHLLCKIIEGQGNVRLETGGDAGAPLMVNAPIAPSWVD